MHGGENRGWEEKKKRNRKDTWRILQVINGSEEKHTRLHMKERDRKYQAKNIPSEKTRQRFTKHKRNGR